ncbi:MAG: hypothetical protein EXX96DRAFT_633642 [Benjaminiella poitrasii]|nr:MAG: hypothetical protein EXX96DRAFT_633642 [Benjaminiella poitrasii]
MNIRWSENNDNNVLYPICCHSPATNTYGGSLPGTPGSAMSVGSSLAPGDRILIVKCSINSIQWSPEFHQQLDQFINDVNKVTTHAYSFNIYIFLRAFIEYENFYISQYINREFFDEVWLPLTLYVRGARVSARTLERREFIGRYLPDFCRIANYQRTTFRYGQQSSLIEGTKIYTAYINNVNMVDHFFEFYELARVFVNLQLPGYNCFPLRKSWSPSYATIDSKCLCQNIFGLSWTNFTGDKLTLWERVVDLNSAPFRHQEDGVLRFLETIQTDGVGVSIIKKRTDRQGRHTIRYTLQVEKVRYISDLSQEENQPLVGRCVTVDPGRRDLVYFVQEDSTTEEPMKWRYTKPHQDKFQKRKKYRNSLQDIRSETPVKTSILPQVESNLPSTPSTDRNPLLKGSFPESVFIDITHVRDVKKFFTEFASFCNYTEHIWGFEEKPRNDDKRLFSEFVLSSTMLAIVCDKNGFTLPSFSQNFFAFPSLPADSKLIKITLTGLPQQYGRMSGGSGELYSNMLRNLKPYGSVVDCGIITSIHGLFTGRGYVALEVSPTMSDCRPLSHNIHWQYHHLSIHDAPRSTPSSGTDFADAITVHAHWASMPSYCRYCHAPDHVLNDCAKRQRSFNCYNCNETGHISRNCPRRNASASSKKARKLPVALGTETLTPGTSTPAPSPTPASMKETTNDSLMGTHENKKTYDPFVDTPEKEKPREPLKTPADPLSSTNPATKTASTGGPCTRSQITTANITTTGNTSSSSAMHSISVCRYCGLEGHQRTTSKQCLLNPANQQLSRADDSLLPIVPPSDRDPDDNMVLASLSQ